MFSYKGNLTFIVVAYYSMDSIYEQSSKRLIKSLKEFNIMHYVEGIECKGSWYNNCAYKPTFLKQMMEKFKCWNIVYVDADAEFRDYPELFNNLDCNIAVHLYDRERWFNRKKGTEILSGTIFLRNCAETLKILDAWEERCCNHPKEWDQIALSEVIGKDFGELPAEYCQIYDTMRNLKNPVITHYQMSREVRINKKRDKPGVPRLK